MGNVDEEKRKRVEKLLDERACVRGCKCYHVNFNDLCKARSFGIEALLECLEDDPKNCKFAFPFGGSHFCKCALRQEIARILEE